ncbi:MAG TPA: universal stress protein [Gemmatimonadaceae bacterium]|nr:universal stress protein [Gemmatimonadaceae bacterium]
MYKVIMAPTEGSDSEKPAVLAAVRLAQQFDATLRLVRVDPAPLVLQTVPRQPVLEITEDTLRGERRARQRKLETEGAEYRKAGIRVITSLEDGPVGPVLREYAEKFGVDLIVMSSHARGGIKRITLGSVTDYLIRHTHIPVLVVKEGTTLLKSAPSSSVTRIVVPLDGSALAEQILPDVASLALRINATVSLVQVLTPTTYSQERIMQPGLPWWDADMAAAEEYLTRAAAQLAEDGVAVSKDVVLGENVAQSVLDYAQRARADLLAIATSGAGGMTRFVFGSVADEVTRKSPTSLLVFHPEAQAAGKEAPAANKALVEL